MSRIIIVLSCLAIAMYAGTISFDELQTSAIEHSSRIKLRSIDTSIETARLESVYSTLYPQLSLGYSGEYSKNLDNTASGSISVGDTTINSTTLYKNSASLRLNYELYHFGTTLKQIEMSKKEIAVKKLEQCNETIKLNIELLDQYAKAQKVSTTSDYKSRMLILRKELYVLKQRLYAAGKESRISIGDEAIRIMDIEHEIEKANMDFAESLIALSKLSYAQLDPKNIQLLSLTTLHSSVSVPFDLTPQSQQYE
jgi:outer membrane protein TolC